MSLRHRDRLATYRFVYATVYCGSALGLSTSTSGKPLANMTHSIYVSLALLACTAACSPPPDANMTDAERRTTAAAVDSATNSFRNAQRALDTERTVAHIAPDFTMYLDGARTTYDSVIASIRASLPTFTHVESQYSDVSVRVLSRDAAVVSFTFRDSVVTNAGVTMRFTGPTTLVWERRGDDWRIVHADADHYPVQP